MDDTLKNFLGAKVQKRSVTLSGHSTSVSLEEPFWNVLQDLATRRGISINTLISEIDAERSGNLSSALRLYVLHEIGTDLS